LAISYYDQSATGTAAELVLASSSSGFNIVTLAASGASTALPTQVVQLTGGSYIVEWDTPAGANKLAPVSETGTVLNTDTLSTAPAGELALAPTLGGNFASAGSFQGSIYFNIEAANSFNILGGGQVSPNGEADDLSPAIATLANGDFVVAWYNGSTGNIEAQLLSPAGSLIGSPVQVNTNTTGVTANLSVAGLANGDFVVTWADDNGQTATIEDQIFSLIPATPPY
jgi:hypothetical protein